MENKKSFKQYYADPEYKSKHLTYIKEKISCPGCGAMVMRCNLSKHKKSKIHDLNEKLLSLKKNIKNLI